MGILSVNEKLEIEDTIAVRRNIQREAGTVLLLREIPRKIASPTLRAAGISAATQHFCSPKGRRQPSHLHFAMFKGAQSRRAMFAVPHLCG